MSINSELAIQDVFRILGRGLVIVPIEFRSIFPEFIQPIETKVEIVRIDGARFEFDAIFSVEHFSFTDGGAFSLIALLPKASRDDVPEGSCLALKPGTLNLLRSLVHTL